MHILPVRYFFPSRVNPSYELLEDIPGGKVVQVPFEEWKVARQEANGPVSIVTGDVHFIAVLWNLKPAPQSLSKLEEAMGRALDVFEGGVPRHF